MEQRVSAESVLFVGVFPPPVSGANVALKAYFEKASQYVEVVKCDVSVKRAKRDWLFRLGKGVKNLILPFLYIIWFRFRGVRTLYKVPDSGFGAFFDAVNISLAKALGYRIVFHHHSYGCINRRSLLFKCLNSLLDCEDVQIFLSPGMLTKYSQEYKVVSKLYSLSNLAFVPMTLGGAKEFKVKGRSKDSLVVGFLGNITQEKGSGIWKDVVLSNPCAQYLMAGPVNDGFSSRVLSELEGLDNFNYIGPVYGDDKVRFFNSVDVLLFPTIYKNEAQPIVILEAMSYGVPVYAIDAGSIREMLPEDWVFNNADEFVNGCGELIREDVSDKVLDLSEEARSRFVMLMEQSKTEWDAQIEEVMK